MNVAVAKRNAKSLAPAHAPATANSHPNSSPSFSQRPGELDLKAHPQTRKGFHRRQNRLGKSGLH